MHQGEEDNLGQWEWSCPIVQFGHRVLIMTIKFKIYLLIELNLMLYYKIRILMINLILIILDEEITVQSNLVRRNGVLRSPSSRQIQITIGAVTRKSITKVAKHFRN